MSSTLTFRGRLPGVAVEAALPPTEQPVRLDVAGFVGFAEKGPLDTPVAVEDPAQYAAVFGGDLALAQEAGRPVWAQLPTAVRSFFDNGGRRCYVVRVAGPLATSARWLLPGLEIWSPGSAGPQPAAVSAAWPGGWAARTSISTVLVAQQLVPEGTYRRASAGGYGSLPLDRRVLVGLRLGDLLRLDLGPLHPGLVVRVRGTDPASGLVRTDREVAFEPGGTDPSGVSQRDVPSTVLPVSLPSSLPVLSARLVRFDLVVRHRSESGPSTTERWSDLSFGPAATDVLQHGEQPDLARSLLLRNHPDTEAALLHGLAAPVGMSLPEGTTPADDGGFEDEIEAAEPLVEGDDDLGEFPAGAFVDARLSGASVFSLLPEAEQLTSLAHDPVRLRGLHSLIGIDEVALVAMPDAGQRGWGPPQMPEPDPVVVPEPPPVVPVDWSGFRCCAVPEPVATPEPVEPPEPSPLLGLPELDPVAWFDDDALITRQVALVTMCAARADQVALLSVPQHYDVAATLAWRERLRTDPRVVDSSTTAMPPLGYAGLWHPWVSVSVGTSDGIALLRDVPPDGLAAGSLAARELARGPWVAPAGTPLRGLLRTVPTLTRAEEAALFDAHANLVTHPPGSFTVVSAHTLTDDPALLQVSVRRLLIWIRKVALRLGQRYTFEVDNDHFRQLVLLRFDRILRTVLERGGLAAYQVVDDPTPEDRANGRFVVLLQVAPTSPVEFITVTLRRSGEGLLDVLEG